jgi:RHS repeat-associated protein
MYDSGPHCYDAPRYKFTGKERNRESGLDNFGERYFGSSLGRFMRPDPSSVSGDVVDEQNPQAWNMYSYVQNNPTNAIDPDGLDCVYTQNLSKDGTVTVERGNCTQEGGNYVNGTIDTNSLTYNSKTNEIGFTFSNEQDQTGGAGTISLGPKPGSNNSNSGELNPFAQGVFTQLNQMNIMNNTLKIYGASVVLGITGGAACYYLCPEAGITTLGLEGAGEASTTVTTGNAASISRAAAQGGRKAVERALRSYQKRLAEYLAKLNEIKGDPGSVQREINNFRGLIKAAEDWLSKNP